MTSDSLLYWCGVNPMQKSNLPWSANPSYELRKVVQVFSGTNTSPKQPAMIYHLLSSEEASETVFEELSPEGVSAQTSFPSATAKGEFNLKLDQVGLSEINWGSNHYHISPPPSPHAHSSTPHLHCNTCSTLWKPM